MTVLEFFSGLFPFPVDDSFIVTHCGARGIDAELTPFSDIDADERALIKADLLKGLALASIGWQSETSSTAFKSREGGDAITPLARRSMLMEANSLYFAHGEPENAYKLNAINVWENEKGC